MSPVPISGAAKAPGSAVAWATGLTFQDSVAPLSGVNRLCLPDPEDAGVMERLHAFSLESQVRSPLAVLGTLVAEDTPTLIIGSDSGALMLASTRFGERKHPLISVSPFLDSSSAHEPMARYFPDWPNQPHFLFAMRLEPYLTQVHPYLPEARSVQRVHFHESPELGDVDLAWAVSKLSRPGVLFSFYGFNEQLKKAQGWKAEHPLTDRIRLNGIPDWGLGLTFLKV